MTRVFLMALIFLCTEICTGQNNIIDSDYLIFGRKEPASPGSVFSALGNEPVFLNPAGVALVTDNRVTVGGNASDLGTGYVLSWTAPNLSISSAMHSSTLEDSGYSEYRKELLKFSFGLSTEDIGYRIDNMVMALGISVKRMADRSLPFSRGHLAGMQSESTLVFTSRGNPCLSNWLPSM